MKTTLKTRWPVFWKIAIGVLLITPAFIGVAMWKNWESVSRFMPTKPLWDWIQLLIVPLIMAGGLALWARIQQETERQRAMLKREIATDGQQESAFQDYINRMTELLLKEKLSKFSSEEVRNAARVRTLASLRGLDPKRKGFVLLFLKDSGLVEREAVVDLYGADLSQASLPSARLSRINLGEANLSKSYLCAANLSNAYLGEVNLSGSNLSWANLSGADLFGANLSGADLTRADLSGAKLNGANLTGCRLGGANLSDADLTGVNLNVGDLAGANLRGAKLGGAELVGTDLSEADLSQADLSGTRITRTNLDKAKSLDGTTLPDGTKNE